MQLILLRLLALTSAVFNPEASTVFVDGNITAGPAGQIALFAIKKSNSNDLLIYLDEVVKVADSIVMPLLVLKTLTLMVQHGLTITSENLPVLWVKRH